MCGDTEKHILRRTLMRDFTCVVLDLDEFLPQAKSPAA